MKSKSTQLLVCKLYQIIQVFVLLAFFSIIEILDSNLTIYHFEHPTTYEMEYDPRPEYRELYQRGVIFSLQDIYDGILGTDQALLTMKDVYRQNMKRDILAGRPPGRFHLPAPFMSQSAGHFVRSNDVIGEAFNWALAWMMDCGIVKKIYSPHYMFDGKLLHLKILRVSLNLINTHFR